MPSVGMEALALGDNGETAAGIPEAETLRSKPGDWSKLQAFACRHGVSNSQNKAEYIAAHVCGRARFNCFRAREKGL